MKTIRFILISCLVLLTAVNVQANDYLEHQDHYTVMNQGNGAIHFKIFMKDGNKWNNFA